MNMMFKKEIDPKKVTGFYEMHLHPDGLQAALPLSFGDVFGFEPRAFLLPNVKVYNLYALPVKLKGNLIFHAEVKAKPDLP